MGMYTATSELDSWMKVFELIPNISINGNSSAFRILAGSNRKIDKPSNGVKNIRLDSI